MDIYVSVLIAVCVKTCKEQEGKEWVGGARGEGQKGEERQLILTSFLTHPVVWEILP